MDIQSKYYPEIIGGKRYLRCLLCDQRCSSKQRILSHITAIHKDEQELSGSKDQCFVKLGAHSEVKQLFQCKICSKALSSKQRIQQHLFKYHKKSPVSKVYGCYKEDPSKPVPDRTLRRQKNVFNESCAGLDIDTGNISDSSDHGGNNSDGAMSGIEPLNDSEDDNNAEPNENETNPQLVEHFESSDQNFDNLSQDSVNSDWQTSDSGESLFLNTSSSDATCDSDEEEFHNTGSEPEKYSKEESLALCASAYIARFRLPGDAAKHLNRLVGLYTDSDSNSLKKPMESNLNYNCISYCSVCKSVFEGDIYICETNNCGNFRYKGGLQSQTLPNRQPRTSFIIADIESQLKLILEKKDVWQAVQEKKRNASLERQEITDIMDGEYYRSLCKPGSFLHNINNLSAIFNTDGVPLYSSSNVKLWPIFLAVNELPVQLRFSRENIVLAGIWQGKEKPPFLQYLWMFGEEMCRLKDEGLTISPPGIEEESIHVKLAVLCGSVDLQAKAYILNMSMFNGAYGCSTCEEIGIVEPQGRGYARCYPFREVDDRPPLRNSDDVKLNKGPSARKKSRITGICGISGLSVMTWFDVVLGILPDYMHGVLMGVTKKLLYLWFSSTSSGKPYFVGKHLQDISKRLQNISPPDYVERLPRDLEKHYTNFKATELQTWLLFYAIPCMTGYLPEEYHSHFCLLSEGVYLLLGDRITNDELLRAENLLETFYRQFPELYNRGSCGLNVHNVGVHLTFFVRQWGPLWAWSCFPFEDANAAVLNSIHGTGDVTRQCFRVKDLQLRLKNIDLDRVEADNQKLFIKEMTKSARSWKTKPMANCNIPGRQAKITEYSTCNEDLLLTEMNANSMAEIRKVERVQLRNGANLYCEEYTRMKKRICFVVCTKDGKILNIKHFLINTATKQVFAVSTLIRTSADGFHGEYGRHIIKVEKTDEVLITPVDIICEKVFFMEVDGNQFVSRLPNLFGHCVFK